ncbi:unnamed protein product [Ectocarpus sp. 12 AP-2014]
MRRRAAATRRPSKGMVGDFTRGMNRGSLEALHFLCWAVQTNQEPDVIFVCASRCPDLSACGPDVGHFPPLHLGAGYGHVDAMHTLLELGARVDAVDRSKRTALHVAVQNGQADAVRLLVAARANLEARDWFGRTPLHHACNGAHVDGLSNIMAHLLLLAGANVHSLDECSCTPTMLAMDNERLMKRILLVGPRPSRETARLYAAKCTESSDSERLLEILAKRGWAPAPSDSNGGGGDSNGGGNHREGGVRDRDSDEDDCTAALASFFDGRDDNRGGRCEDLPLHEAIMTEDVRFVVELLEVGEDPNALNRSGWSPLHVATRFDVAMVEALIDAGANVGLRRPRCGSTALHMSAMKGRVEVTEALLAADLSNNGDNSACGSTAAARVAPYSSVTGGGAASAPNATTADGKFGHPSSMVDAKDYGGKCPLHLAAINGTSTGVVEALLRAGADVNSRDEADRTPLIYAATASTTGAIKTGVVKALLEAGASPDLKDANGETALHKAVLMPAGGVLAALLAGGASPGLGGEKGWTPLHVACEYNARGTVAALLRAGAVPGHCWNEYLRPPLTVACMSGRLGAVELLLPRLSPRQINMRDRMSGADDGGVTPLVAAVWYACEEEEEEEDEALRIVEALLAAGADPTLRAFRGMTPLESVSRGASTKASPTFGPSLVRMLVAAGADVNDVGSTRGCTPLHFACMEGACAEVVQALLDAGADAGAPCAGMRFMTPLQLAGGGGNAEAVEVLIGRPECGGLNAIGCLPSRATALACAVNHGNTEVCRFLLERGANMDLLPSSFLEAGGGKPLNATSLVELAAQCGHLDTMNLLIQAKVFKDNTGAAVGVQG